MHKFHKLASSLVILGLVVALIMLPTTSETQAQDGSTVSYGETVAGVVAAGIPSDYSFEANAGDVAEVTVLGFGFAPRVQVLDGTRTQVLAENANPDVETTVELSYSITEAGTYFIRVQGLTASDAGDFGLSLAQGERELPPGTSIAIGETLQGTVDDPEVPAVYDFTTDPNGLVNVSVRSLTGGYNPIVTLLTEEGDTIIAGGNPRLLGFSFLLAPSEENLKLVVDLGSYEGSANFEVELAAAVGIEPIATEQPTDNGGGGGGVDNTVGLLEAPSGCYVSTNQNVNIRSGGSTNHSIVDVFGADKYLSVTGYNDTNDRWYQVSIPDGRSGWVAGFVVAIGGPCDNLSEATFPPAEGGDQPTATYTLEGGITATPTYTLEGGVTATPSYTPTTESGGTAPPDNDINTEIDYRDGFQTFSGQISYPDGDTTDYINYTVIGFDSVNTSGNVNIAVTCSGTGTEFVRINFQNRGSVGETTCPHNLTKFFTDDSDLGWVRIDLIGGDNALVNWTVTLTGQGN